MRRLDNSRRAFLWEAAMRYHTSLNGSPAEGFLASTRKLPLDSVGSFRLGYVADPMVGHEQYRGMLAIPYIRQSPRGDVSIVSIRFRCCQPNCGHDNHPKYATVHGDTSRLFNTVELANDDWIAVCEGELDAITATALCGIPTVAVPGAQNWQPHWAVPFLGFGSVFVFTDNDDSGAGREFGNTVAGSLWNARVVPCRKGHDVNSEYVEHGPDAIRAKIGEV